MAALSNRDHSIQKAVLFRTARMSRNGMRHAVLTLLLTSPILLLGVTSSPSEIACKPLLSVKNVREVRLSASPAVPWTWRATITADISHCATQSGIFEIDFVRIKENSPDLQFTERFYWRPLQFDVSMDLTSDESILEHRIGFAAPCVCRESYER
jgi:hypothetical protein